MKNNICSKCGKIIPADEIINNGGFCSNCMKKRERELSGLGISEKREKHSQETNKGENKIANIIKGLAILIAILGTLVSFSYIDDLEGLTFVYIIASIISAIFIYAIGEGLQLLQEIVNNTQKTFK